MRYNEHLVSNVDINGRLLQYRYINSRSAENASIRFQLFVD